MSKSLLIGLAAVVIIGGAAALYFMQGGSSAEQGSMTEDDSNAESSASGSLNELIARSGDWKCTVESPNDTAASSGTVYVSNGDIRGDFKSTISELQQSVDSHMIQKDGYVYVWSSLAPQGFRTKTTLGGGDTSGQSVDFSQEYNYDCDPWSPDASVFELPADVTFAGG